MNELLFYEAPEEIFTRLYVCLALLTLALFRNLFQRRTSA
jgi:hypothetical protein